jgi:hypothetical protein
MSAIETQDPMSPDAGTAATAPDTAPRPPVGNALKNGNRGGDPWAAPRCGAKNRSDAPCRGAVMKDKKRCRHHGGASTGPRTAEGRARISKANTRHGGRSAEMRALLAQLRQTRLEAELLVAQLVARQRDRSEPHDATTTPDNDNDNGAMNNAWR